MLNDEEFGMSAPIVVHLARIVAALAGSGHVVDLTRGEGLLGSEIAGLGCQVSVITDAVGAAHGRHLYPRGAPRWIEANADADADGLPVADHAADVVVVDTGRMPLIAEVRRVLASHGWMVAVGSGAAVIEEGWPEVHRFEVMEGPATLLRSIGSSPRPTGVAVVPIGGISPTTMFAVAGPPGTWSRIHAAGIDQVVFGESNGSALGELVLGSDLESLVLSQRDQLALATGALSEHEQRSIEQARVIAEADAREAYAAAEVSRIQRLIDDERQIMRHQMRELDAARAKVERVASSIETLRCELVDERRRSSVLAERASLDTEIGARLMGELGALQQIVTLMQSTRD